MTDTLPLDEIKKRQQDIWSSGSYGKIAWLTVPFGDVLCEAVDVRPGATVLDVATGTGNVALAAARRFCDVTAVDYVPALLAEGRDRAAAEALSVDFRDGDAERLPVPDGAYDYVLSAVGVMFTADHAQAGRELVRACRPGGRIGMANWTPSGFIGDMLKVVGAHAPPPPGAAPPTRWGVEETVRELLGPRVDEVSCTTATVTERFRSAAAFVDFFLENYGPTLKASQRLDEAGREALRDDLVALVADHNQVTDGTVRTDWEYLLTVARKA